MKLKIMIMALLLLAGIGSAVNWLPESTMEPGANLSYYDSGSNLQTFDFSTEPVDGNIWTSISDSWSVVAAKYIDGNIVVGPESDTWSIFYNYKTDGVDDDVQIQAAIDELSQGDYATGGTVHIRRGFYYLNSTVNIARRIHLQGCAPSFSTHFTFVENDPEVYNRPPATIYMVTHNDTEAFLFYNGAGISDCVIYYPDQVTNDTPIEYPATFLLHWSWSNNIENIYAINPYTLIQGRIERSYINNIFGGPIYRGIYADEAGYDFASITNTFFNGYSSGGSVLNAWVREHGVAFEFSKSDGLMLSNIGTYGYNTALIINGTDGMMGSNLNFEFGSVAITNITWATSITNLRTYDCASPALLIKDSSFVTITGYAHTGNVSTCIELSNAEMCGIYGIGIREINATTTGILLADDSNYNIVAGGFIDAATTGVSITSGSDYNIISDIITKDVATSVSDAGTGNDVTRILDC